MFDWDNMENCTVLVIDDEPDNVEVVLIAMQYFGVDAHSATSGKTGIEALETISADLILLDLSMKDMDGWETRANIKANPAMQHIPIIALTAHAMAGDKERALQAGFDGYLTKPINIPTILNDIRATLEENAKIAQVAAAVETTLSRSKLSDATI